MDCQKLLIYGLVALIGLYFLRETCGLKLPFIDTQEGFLDGLLGSDSNGANMNTNGVAPNNNNVAVANNNVAGPTNGVRASEELGDETFLRVSGINRTPTSCYPQNTLKPKDLLPSGKSIFKKGDIVDCFLLNYLIHLNQISLSQTQMLILYFLKFQQV